MIKTADEVANEQASILIDTCGLVNDADRFSLVLALTKQNQKIQLNAIKHGLSLAIDTISRAEEQYEHPHEHALSEVKKQIIEEREKLKEV